MGALRNKGTYSINDINAMLNLPITSLVSNVWTIDTNKLRSYQTQCTTADANAKTLTFSNLNSTADYLEFGVRLKVTTSCTITYTNCTFIDGVPTLVAGDVWLLAFESVDNGSTFNAIAIKIEEA